MIQLQQQSPNEFIIYTNTITNDVQEFGDYFLIGFLSGFTKKWSYVIPYVIERNSRYLKFEITLVPNVAKEDLYNGKIYLSPSGNWDYKIWNLDNPTLDPALGNLIDKGQMIMDDQVPKEIVFDPYISTNDTLKSVVYYTSSGVWNNTRNIFNAYGAQWQSTNY